MVLPRGRKATTREEADLLAACTTALRAWIVADKYDLPGAMHERLLENARLLTGRAVDKGLLTIPLERKTA